MAGRGRLMFVPEGHVLTRSVIAAVAMLLLPLNGGLPGAMGALFLGWMLAAALFPVGGLVALAPIAAAAIGCAIALPEGLQWCVLPWAVLGTCGVLFPMRTWQRRAAFWGMVCAAFACTVLQALSLRYGGASLAVGLAQEIADAIHAAPNRDAILVSAYQAGLAELDEAYATLPALRIGEAVLLLPAVRMQLLYALRTNMEYIMAAGMPGMIVSYIALTTLLCTILPDEMRRRQGIVEDPLPAIETWRLPQRMPGGVILICLLGLLPYLTANHALAYLGMMCSTAADWVFMLAGAGLLAHLLKKRGVSRRMRMVTPLVLAVVLPQALVILGIADVFVPLRPRSDADKEGGYQE